MSDYFDFTDSDGRTFRANPDLRDVGGSEYLWDNWCGYVAEKNNTTADAVSNLHVSAIME